MNNLNALLILLLNTLYIHGMDDYKEIANPLNKSTERAITPPIEIPTRSIAVPIASTKKPADQPTKYIIISPTDHLFWLGNHGNSSPEKRSPGTSLR